MAWDEESILSNDVIISAMNKNDDVTSEAIIVAGRRNIEEALSELEKRLDDEDQEIRAASANAIIQ